jgi:Barstar (barnase inhibitor)
MTRIGRGSTNLEHQWTRFLRLIDGAHLDFVLEAHAVDGFFIEEGSSSDLATFRGAVLARASASLCEYEESELKIRDHRQETIGSYYIGSVKMLSVTPESRSGLCEVAFDFHGSSVNYPAAETIWRRWVGPKPLQSGEWRRLSGRAHSSWLHVVQNAWGTAGREIGRELPRNQYTLAGQGLTSIDSLFCELGECINGPGGYFGASLSGLNDCLLHSGTDRFRIIWRNHHDSLSSLGERVFGNVVRLLQDHDVEVSLR